MGNTTRKRLLTPIVRDVLEINIQARNDDFVLVSSVWEEINPLAGNMFVRDVTINHAKYGLPSWETITRIRRNLQNRYPDLRADESVEQMRDEREEEFHNTYKEN